MLTLNGLNVLKTTHNETFWDLKFGNCFCFSVLNDLFTTVNIVKIQRFVV